MKYVYIVALGGCVWTTLFFALLFLKTLIFGRGEFLADIDTYREGWLEFTLMAVFVTFGAIGLVKLIRR